MEEETKQYIENIDSWIKEINQEIAPLKELRNSLAEAHRNIQHNYELIYELKENIENLAEQMKTVSLILATQYKKQCGQDQVIRNLEPLLISLLEIAENGKKIRGPRKESHAVRDY